MYTKDENLLAPQVGLEPTTLRLTAACSTDWAIEEYLVIKYSLPNFEEYSFVLRTYSGSDLSSRAVTHQVFSALQSLTSVFGMGTGVTSAPLPPDIFFSESLCFQN